MFSCCGCKETKDKKAFSSAKNFRGYDYLCKACRAKRTAEYRRRNPERVRKIAEKARRKQGMLPVGSPEAKLKNKQHCDRVRPRALRRKIFGILERKCCDCAQWVRDTEFNFLGGSRSYCQECHKKQVSNRYKKENIKIRERQNLLNWENRTQVRETHRSFYYKNTGKHRARQKTYEAKKPYVIRRQQQLLRAKKRGEITVPPKCDWCPRTENIEAHHWTYEGPFNIQWLCKSCHRKYHNKHPLPSVDFEDVAQKLGTG